MAVLPRAEFISRIRAGDLVLSPLLSKKQIGSCSIDLRLGTIALMVRARGLSHVDPRNYASNSVENPIVAISGHAEERQKRQKLERHEIPFLQRFLLHPGMLVLAPTFEWIALPSDLQGIVTARSCWAREGLNIATATFIGPGYRGIITLELSNLGQIPIALYPGLRVAQIAFLELGDGFETAPPGSQFDMSFEPMSGKIADGEKPFLPPDAAEANLPNDLRSALDIAVETP